MIRNILNDDFYQYHNFSVSSLFYTVVCGSIFLAMIQSSGKMKKCVHSRITREPDKHPPRNHKGIEAPDQTIK